MNVTTLLAQSRHHRQHSLHKLASTYALRSKAHLPQQHWMTDLLFGVVVRRINTLHSHERKECIAVIEDVLERAPLDTKFGPPLQQLLHITY
jgi:hypothetical protein